MTTTAEKTDLASILPLCSLFLQEANFQIRYNARHERGRSDSYLLASGGPEVGYGSIMGREISDRDTVFEYFIVPSFRNMASELFSQLLLASRAQFVECQSNDLLLSSMLFEFARSISADVVLFEDHFPTDYVIPNALFRRRHAGDQIFEHHAEPTGDYVLELSGEIVATGGFMLHYNHPFADLYMEVREDCRRRGMGSFLLQEVKKLCYLAGRVPAARTDIGNVASRACLTKAGLRVCGFMLTGQVATKPITTTGALHA